MVVLIGVSLSHFLTSYPIIYSIRHPKCQLILLALIHCMSARSQKGVDQIDLYLADGLGMSHNKIPKIPCVKFSRFSSQQILSTFYALKPSPIFAREHRLETFESRTTRALPPLCSYFASFNTRYRLLLVIALT